MAHLLHTVGVLASSGEGIEDTRHGERVDDPSSASFTIQERIEAFTRSFFDTYGGLLEESRLPPPWVRPERIVGNLRSVTITNTYFLLAFTEFARYWHRVHDVPTRRLVVISPAAVIPEMLAPGWAGDDVEFDRPANRSHSLLFWMARSLLQCAVEALRPRRSRPPGLAAVGVECAHGLDRSAWLDDLFWWWESGIASDRVILIFDRADYPATRDRVSEAQRLGLRCVVFNRQATGDLPHLRWRPSPGATISLRRLWRKCLIAGWGLRRGPVGRRIACQLLQLSCWAERWEDFLVEFGVQALFHYQDTGMDSLSVACDAAEAVRIGHQWSHLPWPMSDQIRLHQAYFAWGEQCARCLQMIGSCVDHLLLSGCIVQGAHPRDRASPTLRQHRADLEAHGARRILALFDSSLPCEKFYEFFLRRVLEDARWGLLIKPKRPTSVSWVRQRLPALEALYHDALATGRIRMVDWRISPGAVATVADVAVGISVMGIGSAATVAALAGQRVVQLDYLRLHASYSSEWATMYRAGPNRLVFDDPERLWAALNRFFDEPGAEPGLGMMEEPLLQAVDPFRDGRAGERIGRYVRWYLEGLDGGLPRDQALREATRRYAGQWGAHTVIRGLPAAGLPMDALSELAS